MVTLSMAGISCGPCSIIFVYFVVFIVVISVDAVVQFCTLICSRHFCCCHCIVEAVVVIDVVDIIVVTVVDRLDYKRFLFH